MIRYFFYNLLLYLLTPFVGVYLLLSPKNRELIKRFSPSVPTFKKSPLWIHACSVGEVNVAKGLIEDLFHQFPEQPVLLSVSTSSGYRLANALPLEVKVAFAPFDVKPSVCGFLKRTNPCGLVIIETEIWPNMIKETALTGIPVLIVNGRISNKRFPRYIKYKSLMPPFYYYLDCVAVQNSRYAERFQQIGVEKSKIQVTGNMKNDAVVTEILQEECIAFRRENGFSEKDLLLTFGSTRPGDEQLAADCWQLLKEEFPLLRLILAPRHQKRLDEALIPFGNQVICKRSDVTSGCPNWQARIFVVDTMGELTKFYAISNVAVIGGSFFPGVEGHNPLESAALGIPTVFGPYMGNFPDAAMLLLNAEGARQGKAPNELAALLRELLKSPESRALIAERGREAVLQSRGAVARSVEEIRRCLEKRG